MTRMWRMWSLRSTAAGRVEGGGTGGSVGAGRGDLRGLDDGRGREWEQFQLLAVEDR